jgi:hypothetical protein
MRRLALLLLVTAAAVSVTASGRPDLPTAAHPATPRIVAVGDVHGANERFAQILEKAGLVDAQQRWLGGNAILVQTGDITDRGTGMRAALDLLMALESQASAAGGRVHALLGNHEVMNLVGELRDTTPEIIATFGSDGEMREAFGPRGRYGRWIRSHSVVADVDGSIFLHGGINPDFSNASVNDINRRTRTEITQWDEGVKWLEERKLVSASPKFLDAVEAARTELERLIKSPQRDEPETRQSIAVLAPVVNVGSSSLFNPEGPLWFRGFSTWTDAEGAPRIEEILKKLRGKRLVTGHTVQQSRRITERFDGRLFLIDTGMLGGRFFPMGRASALTITDGVVAQLYLD